MIHMTTERQHDGSYRALCRCPWGSAPLATQEEARRAGDDHLALANAPENTGLIADASGSVVSVDDNLTVAAGTEGTVTLVGGAGQVSVDSDNGHRLSLLPGVDSWGFA